MSRKNSPYLKVIFIAVLVVIVISVAAYLLLKRQASANTSELIYPSWIDPAVIQQAATWNTNVKSMLISCFQGGGVTEFVSPANSELSVLGSKAKAFMLTNPMDIAIGGGFHTDKFRIALAPTKFQSNNDDFSYNAAFSYIITNTNDHPIYLKEAVFQINFIGTPYGDQSQSQVVTNGGAYVKINGGNELKLLPGQTFTGQTGEIMVTYGALYSTFLFGTQLYVTNPAGEATWGGQGTNGLACISDPFSLNYMSSGAFPGQGPALMSSTPTSTLTPAPSSSVTVQPTPSPELTVTSTEIWLHEGFNAIGSNYPLDPDYVASKGLHIYDFNGSANQWAIYPGGNKFQTKAFKGYYVYAPQDTTIRLNFSSDLPSTFPLTSGWNLLWSPESKNLDNLMLTVNGATASAEALIAQGKISERVFVISDDTANASCTYFSILSETLAGPMCENQTPAFINSTPAGKTFWVYVKPPTSYQVMGG